MDEIPGPLRVEIWRTAARVADLADELAAIVASTVDAALDDEHDPDGATVGFERARVTALLAQASEHLAQVECAAARSATDQYGQCSICGLEIGPARLAALPATDRCITCARGNGSGRR